MQKYSKDIEDQMLNYYSVLGEKSKRHYAALEAQKLGHGGKRYIGRLLGVSQKTLRKGTIEINNEELMLEIPEGKERRVGGGRKKKKKAIQM